MQTFREIILALTSYKNMRAWLKLGTMLQLELLPPVMMVGEVCFFSECELIKKPRWPGCMNKTP